MDPLSTRRSFLQKVIQSVSAGVFVFAYTACKDNGKPEPTAGANTCNMNELSAEDLKTRTNLAYHDKAPTRDKRCEICALYLAPKSADGCSQCQLFKGPISPEGTCIYFAPKTENK